MNLKDKRIAVLLSGGVDSSVVLYELVQQGLHPDCFYIKIGPDEDEEWDCSSEEDLEMATAVRIRGQSYLHLFHRVPGYLVPIFLMAVNDLQLTSILMTDSCRHLQILL